MPTPPFSSLDAQQCVRGAYDELLGLFRTSAIATVIGGDITIESSHLDDSMRLGNGTDYFTSTYIGSHVPLDVFALLGNAAGLADFGAGITTAQTLRVVLPTDQTAIPVTGTITTSPDVNIHDSAGNSLNSTSNALNSFITNFPIIQPISGTITANQGTAALPSDAWYMRITDGATTVGITSFSLNTILTNDQSYGIVSSNTVRTASQIGNATGAALFGAGTTTAQVLRVVLPTDQTAIPVTQSGTWSTGRTWTLASGTDSVSAVQSGTWNINNISGTISLPTGASTSALQTTGNTSLSSILSALTLAQGSTTSGQTGNLILGAVTTAAPTYTTGQSNPLSLDTAGNLRVSGSFSDGVADKTTFTYGTTTFQNV